VRLHFWQRAPEKVSGPRMFRERGEFGVRPGHHVAVAAFEWHGRPDRGSPSPLWLSVRWKMPCRGISGVRAEARRACHLSLDACADVDLRRTVVIRAAAGGRPPQ